MKQQITAITEALRAGRAQKGLSQRKLSVRLGMPQSHISRIESGAVNLTLSSLIEMARHLDLEVMLVPRKHVVAVEAIVRETGMTARVPAYRLDDSDSFDE